MSHKSPKNDECFILIKAQPHRSSNYFETVCCAGIGRDGKWRRQYPVPFRVLGDVQKFRRWDWIRYEYTIPRDDKRLESQKVVPESLLVGDQLRKSERPAFLNPLVRTSFAEAEERGESLVMLRPSKLELSWEEKSASELADERRKHADIARQMSMFDVPTDPLDPCPLNGDCPIKHAGRREGGRAVIPEELQDFELSVG